MRKFFLLPLLLAVVALITGCNGLDPVDGGTAVSCHASGVIDLDDKVQDEVRISFESFPSTLADWVATESEQHVRPEGVVLLQLMAFELYHTRTSAGEKAVARNNTSSAYSEVMQQLPEIFGKSKSDDKQYARPYIVYSYLEGATPDNGYAPTTPYTIRVRERLNSKQWSEMAGGYVYTLEVYSDGYDTPWRAVQVINQGGVWKVFSSPALYTQCKPAR